MSNDETPITSRRQRRRAQAQAAGTGQEQQLTPAQAEAEARAKAEAEQRVARARAEGLAAAHAAAVEAARHGASSPAPRAGTPPRTATGPAQQGKDAQGSSARSRRALEAALDGGESPHERSSQARARDRATHRALRELAEKERSAQNAAQAGALPSRRALREQHGDTGRVPAVSEEGRPAPETRDGGQPRPGQDQAVPPAGPIPVVPPAPGGPGAPGPVPGVDPAPPTAMQGIVPNGLTVTPALGPETGSFRKLSHEQIAAARELLKEQAKNQAAMIEAQRSGGTDVDPEVLAQQVAMAERAAVLNRRARAKQRLAEESKRESAAPAKSPAPSSTDNLAMVTPLEFVRVPGVPHPVMKPPSTTHVPIATGATGRVTKQPVRTQAPDTAPSAEAAPVSARSAHGLDPLGSAQAGAGRAERERLILLGIGALGVLALIIAVIMTVLGGGS